MRDARDDADQVDNVQHMFHHETKPTEAAENSEDVIVLVTVGYVSGRRLVVVIMIEDRYHEKRYEEK